MRSSCLQKCKVHKENIKFIHHYCLTSIKVNLICKSVISLKAILCHSFTIVLSNGAMDKGWTLVVGVRCVEDVDGDGGVGVVDLDGVLGTMAGAMGFSMPGGTRCPRWTSHCQGPAAACTGLDRCHPKPLSLLPPPHPSVSHASPLHSDCWIAGAWLVIWAGGASSPSPLRPVPGTCFGAPPAPGGSQAG